MKNYTSILVVCSLMSACGDGNTDAPRVSAIEPATGALAGGTVISITGSRFDTDPAPSVLIGGGLAQVEAVSASELRVTVPAGDRASIPLDVTVANAGGATVVPDVFSYRVAPTIFDVRPSQILSPGNTVTIRGDRFVGEGDEEPQVWIGGVAATDVSVVNDTTITATVPSVTGQRLTQQDLRILTGAGEASAENMVRVLEPGLLLGGSSQRYFDPANPDLPLGEFFRPTAFGFDINGTTNGAFVAPFTAQSGEYEIRSYDFQNQELTQSVKTASFTSRRITSGISAGQIYAIGRGADGPNRGNIEVIRQMIRFDSAGVESNFGAPIAVAGRSCIVARPGGGVFLINRLTGGDGTTDLASFDDAGALTSVTLSGDVVPDENCASAAFFDGSIFVATYQNNDQRMGSPESRRLVRIDPTTGAVTLLRELQNREKGMLAIEL